MSYSTCYLYPDQSIQVDHILFQRNLVMNKSILDRYSKISMTQTLMACLHWQIQSLGNFSDYSRNQIFREFSYFIMKMYVMCTH